MFYVGSAIIQCTGFSVLAGDSGNFPSPFFNSTASANNCDCAS
jgi:hypothetical protein